MKRIPFLFLASILVFAKSATAGAGLFVGVKSTYNIPLGRFSEVGQPYFIAGQQAARSTIGIGGMLKYRPPLLSGHVAVQGRFEYLQMDDKSNEIVFINESGDTLGRTDFKYRIIPLTVAIQYSPFSSFSKLQPFLGLGAGTYFYSYVNTGYTGSRDPTFTEMFERDYTRLGIVLEAGSELFISKRWSLDAAIDYKVVFLHKQDTIGIQSNLSSLRYLQIGIAVLYNLSFR